MGETTSTRLRSQILASAIGSITATLTLNPIGVVKVRYQAGQGGLSEIVSKVLQDSGVWGFWTGARLGIAVSLPSTVLYMTSYENIRDYLSSVPLLRGISPGIAGHPICLIFT
jgi:solute carrier family 25, member 39/40